MKKRIVKWLRRWQRPTVTQTSHAAPYTLTVRDPSIGQRVMVVAKVQHNQATRTWRWAWLGESVSHETLIYVFPYADTNVFIYRCSRPFIVADTTMTTDAIYALERDYHWGPALRELQERSQ